MAERFEELRRKSVSDTDRWTLVRPSQLAKVLAALDAAEAEVARLRAALAHSKSPCVYCSLPADEWAKCAHGFPGCSRADDAMGCPELGASMPLHAAETEVARLREALGAAKGCMLNVMIGLEVGIKKGSTIDRLTGGLRTIDAALSPKKGSET